ESKFYLDYDFHKNDVNHLSEIFGKPCWQVEDMISEIVHQIDPSVERMNQSDGRESVFHRTSHGMTTQHHTYAQHLGWHGLFLAAGTLLATFPVTQDWWYKDDPWGQWLSQY